MGSGLEQAVMRQAGSVGLESSGVDFGKSTNVDTGDPLKGLLRDKGLRSLVLDLSVRHDLERRLEAMSARSLSLARECNRQMNLDYLGMEAFWYGGREARRLLWRLRGAGRRLAVVQRHGPISQARIDLFGRRALSRELRGFIRQSDGGAYGLLMQWELVRRAHNVHVRMIQGCLKAVEREEGADAEFLHHDALTPDVLLAASRLGQSLGLDLFVARPGGRR